MGAVAPIGSGGGQQKAWFCFGPFWLGGLGATAGSQPLWRTGRVGSSRSATAHFVGACIRFCTDHSVAWRVPIVTPATLAMHTAPTNVQCTWGLPPARPAPAVRQNICTRTLQTPQPCSGLGGGGLPVPGCHRTHLAPATTVHAKCPTTALIWPPAPCPLTTKLVPAPRPNPFWGSAWANLPRLGPKLGAVLGCLCFWV